MKSEEIKKQININFRKMLQKYFTENQIAEISDSSVLNFEKANFNSKYQNDIQDLNFESILINSVPARILIDNLISYASLNLQILRYVEFLNDLAKYILLKGQFQRSEEIFNIVLHHGDNENGIEKAIGFALLGIADIKSRIGNTSESIHYLHKAKAIFKKLDHINGIVLCEHLFGTIYLEKGSVEAAERKMNKVLQIIDEKENELTFGMIMVNLGIINYLKSDLELSEEYFLKALKIFDTNSDLRRSVEVKHNLGMIYIKRCEYAKASSLYKEIINNAKEHNLPTILNIAYLNQSEILIKMNKLLEANKLLNISLDISTQTNDKLTIADIYKLKGVINRSKKLYAVSEKYLVTSLRINKEFENELNFAETSLELGKLLKEKEDIGNSEFHLKNALKYYTKINAHEEIEMIDNLLNNL